MIRELTPEREDFLVRQFIEGKIGIDQVILDGLGVLEHEAPTEDKS